MAGKKGERDGSKGFKADGKMSLGILIFGIGFILTRLSILVEAGLYVWFKRQVNLLPYGLAAYWIGLTVVVIVGIFKLLLRVGGLE